MVSWKVEPDENTRRIWLQPDNSERLYSLEPGEAWDLGDDLIVAATRLLPFESIGYSTQPPWAEVMILAVVNGRLRMTCQEHHTDDLYPGMMISLDEAMGNAREHWAMYHSAEVDVAEHAEGENGQAHTDPAVPEPEVQAEALGDAHGGGDQVQDDLNE